MGLTIKVTPLYDTNIPAYKQPVEIKKLPSTLPTVMQIPAFRKQIILGPIIEKHNRNHTEGNFKAKEAERKDLKFDIKRHNNASVLTRNENL